MISIAIIDQNETYRKSLKTLLEQVEGFSVVLDSGESNTLRNKTDIPVQVALIDISLGREECLRLVSETSGDSKLPKTIILVMYKDELKVGFGKAITMLKSSGKTEFENCIKGMLKNN